MSQYWDTDVYNSEEPPVIIISSRLQTEVKKKYTKKKFRLVIDVPVFRVGPSEYCIKFQTKLHIIIRGQSLNTGTNIYATTKNLLAG